MKSQKIRGVEHFVYEDYSEFVEHMGDERIRKDWREGQEGDWVLADDGGVVQLLKVSRKLPHKHDSPNYRFARGWVRTIVGSFPIRPQTYMDTDFEKHPNRYTFGGKDPVRLEERETNTERDRIFITKVITGNDPTKVVKEVYRTTSDKLAKNKAALLLRQDRIMNEIRKGVLELADEKGMTDDYIIERLMDLEHRASQDKETLNVSLGALREMIKIKQLAGVQTKQTNTVGIIGQIDRSILESAERKQIGGDIETEEVKREESKENKHNIG